jgi:acetate kinase
MSNKEIVVLTINSGSSSIKFAIYKLNSQEERLFTGKLERIGQSDGRFVIYDQHNNKIVEENTLDLKSHEASFEKLFKSLKKHLSATHIDAIGHRILNGGKTYQQPHVITQTLMNTLYVLKDYDLEHLPNEIKGIELANHYYPNLLQVACFDTSFHRSMPDVAELYAIPRNFTDEGIIRYGFHGLSYEFVLEKLNKLESNCNRKQKVIIAHLGNGASMAAIKENKCIDTSMGFTPTSGLVMSTRCGDIDPGILYFLSQNKKLSVSSVFKLLNENSGLKGVSTKTGDMEDLLKLASTDKYAEEAIRLFCYSAKKYVGSYVAALGGLDTLIFTGGIGENAPRIRTDICQNLDCFGLELDEALNGENAAIISSRTSQVVIRMIPTNEELMIARHTARICLLDNCIQG